MAQRLLAGLVLAAIGCLPASATHAGEKINSPIYAEQLSSADPAVVREGVNGILRQMKAVQKNALSDLRYWWLQILRDRRRHDLIEEICLSAILNAPEKLSDLESFQEIRIQAFIAAGKRQEALSQARALFNVTSMKGTARAVALLADCLCASRDGDTQIPLQLAREQREGATPRPSSAAPSAGGLVGAIVIPDSAQLRKAIDDLTKDDERSQVAKGNLLLLSGRAPEAHALFEGLVARATPATVTPLLEHVARAIRAEDGTIGRANGYILAAPQIQARAAELVPLAKP